MATTRFWIKIFSLGYVGTSVYFFKNPTKINQKEVYKSKNKYLVGAHRGGSRETLENTIPAFKNAISNGADFVELDLQYTKDGKVVVGHDDDLARLTGKSVKISELNYNELPEFKDEIELQFAPKEMYYKRKPTDSSKVELFEDVLKACNGVPMNIDMKTSTLLQVKQVHKILLENNYTDKVVWGSMRDHVGQYCREVDSEVARYALFRDGIWLYVLFYTGLLPFVDLHYQYFEPGYPTKGYLRIHHGWFGSFVPFGSSLLVEHLRKRGIKTISWVINDEDKLKNVGSYGIDGIMTDEPSKMIPKLRVM